MERYAEIAKEAILDRLELTDAIHEVLTDHYTQAELDAGAVNLRISEQQIEKTCEELIALLTPVRSAKRLDDVVRAVRNPYSIDTALRKLVLADAMTGQVYTDILLDAIGTGDVDAPQVRPDTVRTAVSWLTHQEVRHSMYDTARIEYRFYKGVNVK